MIIYEFKMGFEKDGSENVSRLASIKMAEHNISDHIVELKLNYNQQWQNYITEEILEIEEGFESLQ